MIIWLLKVVLSGVVVSSRLFSLTRGLSPHILVRATSHQQRPTLSEVRALMPPVSRLATRCVSSPRDRAVSPLARTCSGTWSFLWRLHVSTRDFFQGRDPHPNSGNNFAKEMAVQHLAMRASRLAGHRCTRHAISRDNIDYKKSSCEDYSI